MLDVAESVVMGRWSDGPAYRYAVLSGHKYSFVPIQLFYERKQLRVILVDWLQF